MMKKKLFSIILLVLAALVLAMAPAAQATSVDITMENWAGPGKMFDLNRASPVASITGTADASGLGTGYYLEITATSTWNGSAATVGETNGGFTVPPAGSANRLKDGSIIYFDMKIKDESDVDVTAKYDFTITDLEAMVSGNQTVMSILVDGTTTYEFHKGSGDARIWASNTTVPAYDVPDPSIVAFAPLGNPTAVYKFNFTGMKLTVAPAGVPAVAFSGAPLVKESGPTSADVTFQLTEKEFPPYADVTVTVTPFAMESGNPDDIQLAGTAGAGLPIDVLIAAANWDDPQTLSVSAIDDSLAEGPEQVGLRFEVSSTDPNYDDQGPSEILVRVVDNDAADICAEVTDGDTIVSESGDTDQLQISLATAPAGDVTVSLTSADGQITADSQELTFNLGNWNVAQSVTISAVDDAIVEEDPHAGYIGFGFTGDAEYAALTNVPAIAVEILENDCGAWGYLPLDKNEDCVVNLLDFVEIAEFWLACTMPNGLGCDDLRQP